MLRFNLSTMYARYCGCGQLMMLWALLSLTGCQDKAPQPFSRDRTGIITADTAIGLAGGVLHDYARFSSHHIEARPICVWLPPGYDDHSDRYPVIYMHDGQNLFLPSRSFIGVDWGVDETLIRFISEGIHPGAIVVGIYNTSKRTEEYAPQKAFEMMPSSRRERLPERFGISMTPISDNYLRFLVTELKPFIDSTYRTLPSREHTFVAGSSMGGLISAYALCEYPSTFHKAACLSTHFPAGDGIMIDYLKDYLPSSDCVAVYFDYGTETLDADYEPYQRRADSVMVAKGFVRGKDWVTYRFEGDEHSERAWRRRLHIPFSFLLGIDENAPSLEKRTR